MTKATKGFDQLDRQFAAIERQFDQHAAQAALEAGAGVVADEMRRLAPVDTGTLRDSITVTPERPGDLYGRPGKDEISVYIGPVGSAEDGDVFYARFVEFGTVRHSGQPFLRPAIASKQDEALRVMTSHLQQSIRRAVK